jgi:hypothetical protein
MLKNIIKEEEELHNYPKEIKKELQYTFNYLTEDIYNEGEKEGENVQSTSHENEANININLKDSENTET